MPKLAIVVAMILVCASLQCVTLCAAPANPPCPHHQKSVDSCSHELVYLQVPAIIPSPLPQASLQTMSFAEQPIETAEISVIRSAPPPLRL
jgi:hypothetical protein